MSDGDLADLFAIPDFWKQSSWHQPQPPLTAPEQEDGFFRLTVGVRDPAFFFLGTDDALPELAQDKDPFFQIPTGLGQQSLVKSAPKPTAGQPDGGSIAQNSSTADSTEQASETANPESDPDIDTIVNDFLLFPDAHPLPPVPPAYQTWEALEHVDLGQTSVPIFATEQGSAFVDALFGADGAGRDANTPPDPVVDTAAYCGCLLSLALGRSSVLFTWDEGKKRFRATIGDGVRISGFTAAALRSFEETCLACGNDTRFLRAFVEDTFTHPAGKAAALHAASTPSRVALARCIEGLLLTLQRELGSWGQQSTLRSLLQLQARIRPAASLLAFVRGLVTRLSCTTANNSHADGAQVEVPDEIFLSQMFREAQATEHGAVFVRNVTKQILQLVSVSWLAFVGAWIGITPDSKGTLWTGSGTSTGKGFVRLDNRVWVDDVNVELDEPDYFFDAAKMPTFIPEEMAQALFETGRNLRFLWTNHPDHPLSNPTVAALRDPATAPPPLQWQFDWDAVHALERRAHAYEQGWTRLLADFNRKDDAPNHQQPCSFSANVPITQILGRSGAVGAAVQSQRPSIPSCFLVEDAAQIEECVEASMSRMDGPPVQPVENELAVVVRQQLFYGSSNSSSRKKSKKAPGVETTDGTAADAAALADMVGALAPHWSLLPLLSFGPVIAAQARLVNGACVRLLFDVHGLRQHLQLQRDFQLLGNGVFCSRLSHALFDPDLVDDGGAGVGGGVLGLRLAGRRKETWPPASSELRLALMGVIAESAYGHSGFSTGSKTSSHPKKQELPGGMSFAVRDLSADEMDQCMDPDGVEALDFLRLTYKPPSALAAVITPGILDKYDRVFRVLLRVLRMYYVVNQLARGSNSSKKQDRNVSTRFRIEARHFVANIMGYFLDTGVGMAWRRLEDWLDNVQQGLAEQDGAADARSSTSSTSSRRHAGRGPTPGPEQLRARHEQVLDEILLVLLLRKRQQPLQQLLQDIFRLILAFAKIVRAEESGDGNDDGGSDNDREERIKKMHASFRKKVAAFLAVCRGLSEKEADSVARKDYQQQQQYQDGSRAGEGSALSILLLMLDYNGTYTAAGSSRSRSAR